MKRLLLMSLVFLWATHGAYAATATFDDLTATIPYTGPGGGTYENGQNLTPKATTTDPWGATVNLSDFTSGGITFANNYTPAYPAWSGWSYSNTTDTRTAGFTNQYSAVTGGANSGGQYGVFFEGFDGLAPTVRFGGAVNLSGAYFTNTTYAYKAVLEGDDGNDPAFVKGPFVEGDWFKVAIWGYDAAGQQTRSLDFYLADYRSADPNDWYVLDSWALVDLSSLGAVHALGFDLDSTDASAFGINTPAYFAMDDLAANPVPIPGAAWLLGSGLLGLIGWRRRRPSS